MGIIGKSAVGWGLLPLLMLATGIGAAAAEEPKPVVVGSKKFTEAIILGDAIAGLLQASGTAARHRPELGGTRILWNALLTGEIDAYAEYTGTIAREILAGEGLSNAEEIRNALLRRGIRMTAPLGFNNTYALGVRRDVAEARGLRTISDLGRNPDLAFGFSNEFMDRGDGWPGLQARYALTLKGVRGLDHDLAYRGIRSGDLAGTDVYTTDAEIAAYDLVVLQDDRD